MLSIFNKNVVFQYKLAIMLAETRELHLGKMRERFGKRAKSCGEHRRAASIATPTAPTAGAALSALAATATATTAEAETGTAATSTSRGWR